MWFFIRSIRYHDDSWRFFCSLICIVMTRLALKPTSVKKTCVSCGNSVFLCSLNLYLITWQLSQGTWSIKAMLLSLETNSSFFKNIFRRSSPVGDHKALPAFWSTQSTLKRSVLTIALHGSLSFLYEIILSQETVFWSALNHFQADTFGPKSTQQKYKSRNCGFWGNSTLGRV